MIKVTCVVTSYDLFPKFKAMLHQCPKVKTLIVMEDQLHPIDMTGTYITTYFVDKTLVFYMFRTYSIYSFWILASERQK